MIRVSHRILSRLVSSRIILYVVRGLSIIYYTPILIPTPKLTPTPTPVLTLTPILILTSAPIPTPTQTPDQLMYSQSATGSIFFIYKKRIYSHTQIKKTITLNTQTSYLKPQPLLNF